MRIPRRHRFRVRHGPDDLFRRLAKGNRLRMGGPDGTETFAERPARLVETEGARGIAKERLREALPRVPDAGRAHFPGGAVGFLAYERGFDVEGLPPAPAPDGPDWHFGIFDTFATFFPKAGELEVTSWGLTGEGVFDERVALARAEDLEEVLRSGAAGPAPASPARAAELLRATLDEPRHAQAVGEILEAIRRGDLYQANLTARFDVATEADPAALFERLLRDNPAPHALFLETGRGTVLSCSPERLLAARGRALQTRPIKGTSSRDADPARDAALGRALLACGKNRAELLMITDLLRNDFGKVCEPGSVRVPRLADVESFAHLHHLVATIEGRLRPELDVFDALEAVFPCGSIAGAPKRRAMQILRALEPAPRGIYTGAVGWVGFDRSADFAVAIRTGFLADGVFSFGSGGGIVADSSAAAEWEELLLKTRAFALALDLDLRGAIESCPGAPRGGRLA